MTAPAAPPLAATLAILSAHGHDLREYVADALQRRLIEHVAARPPADPAVYLARLDHDPGERERLVEALMVSTSQFFRYVEQFHVLREQVVARAAGPILRVWIAGVATGEEAWSIAMVLADAEARGGPAWEVIASDLNVASLAIARAGRYPRIAGASIPVELRAEYTRIEDDELVIADALRSRVVFCRHDLLGPSLAPTEAVLARFDMVLCCNVLIYFERRLQVRALERLVSVLAPGGVLGLGAHERLVPEVVARLRPYPTGSLPVNLFVVEEAP